MDSWIDVTRESMLITLVMAGPLLLVALGVGTLMGMLQALTQIQDATISLVPKMIAILVTLAICTPWLAERMLEFSQRMFGSLPSFLF